MPRKPGTKRNPYDKCKNPKHFNAKPEQAAVYWKLYQQGLSTTEIAKVQGVSRTSVHGLLKSHGYELRKQKRLPFVVFNGNRYTLRNNGYYARTNGKRSQLHRDTWECYQGEIPEGYDIHHINEDKQDNRIENLECILKAEHTRHHSIGKEGGFKKGQISHNARAVRRLDTGEIYSSARQAATTIGISPGAIGQAIKKGTKSAGTCWEYAISIPCLVKQPHKQPFEGLIVGDLGSKFDVRVDDRIVTLSKLYVFPNFPQKKKCKTDDDISPSKIPQRRKKGTGSGYINWRTIKKNGKDYKQTWFHYELWDKGRQVKSCVYVPKKMRSQIEKMNVEKAPVEEILRVLRKKKKR